MNSSELSHHGIKGMKWGVRRTPAQLGHRPASKKKRTGLAAALDDRRKRIAATKSKEEAEKAKVKETDTLKKKSLSKMSDDEVVRAIERAKLEQVYRQYYPEQVSRGKKIASTLFGQVIAPAAVNAGRQQLESLLNNYGSKMIKDAFKDAMPDKNSKEYLTEVRDKLKLKNEIDDLKNPKKSESLDDIVKRLRNEDEIRSRTDSEYNNLKRKSEMSEMEAKIRRNTPKEESKTEESTRKTFRVSNVKKPKTEEKVEVVFGEIVGEGTSKRRESNNTKSSFSNFTYKYGFGEGFVDKTPSESTAIVPVGRSYVTALLDSKWE